MDVNILKVFHPLLSLSLLMLKFSHLQVGSSSGWLLTLDPHSQELPCFMVTRCFRLMSYNSCLRSGFSHFSKEPWFLLGETEFQDHKLDARGCPLFLSHFSRKTQGIYILLILPIQIQDYRVFTSLTFVSPFVLVISISKLSSLKHYLIVFMCQESRYGSTGSSASESLKTEIKVLNRAFVSSESLSGEGSASKFTWLLTGFCSLMVLGLRALITQLLAGC